MFMPKQVQEMLLDGLAAVVRGEKGTARSLKGQFSSQLVNQIIGKTSTAEVVERFSLDGTSGRLKSKMIWFGAVGYEDEANTRPELVVVVYLRHGEWGREAAPLAAKILEKWREIKQKYED